MACASVVKREERDAFVLESGGEKIFGVLHTPLQRGEGTPLVIVLHGFASHKVGTNRSYVTLAQELSAKGIATLRFDFRGAGDSEGVPSKMSLEAFFLDIAAVLRFAKERGFAKIGFYGSSLGGSLAVAAAAKIAKIQSLVLWAPPASGSLWLQDYLASHTQSPGAGAADALKSYRGVTITSQLLEEFGRFRADAAMQRLQDVPFFHLQGGADDTISMRHQEAFEKWREGASAKTRFLSYPSAGHFLGMSKEFPEIIKEVVAWFQETLCPHC